MWVCLSTYFNCSESLHEVIQPDKHQEGWEIPRLHLILVPLVLTQIGPSVLICALEVCQPIYNHLHSGQTLQHITLQDVLWVHETPGLTHNTDMSSFLLWCADEPNSSKGVFTLSLLIALLVWFIWISVNTAIWTNRQRPSISDFQTNCGAVQLIYECNTD